MRFKAPKSILKID
ncbi:hypothetical protein Zm00014a_020551 [Zea mays]|uniref:Uncharacterized protein n=1 Tax=Zea mays TaxID=4577 RepID=A0A3L6F6G8_MAIZE|nr:hypothetical protein Zm00014a_020551 [Zea mays]